MFLHSSALVMWHHACEWIMQCHHPGNCSMFALPPTVNPTTCSSTGSERLAQFFNRKVTTLQAGSPCNDFKGYCDVFMKCRLVDADGPLARLKKAIFNPELYENIAEWIVASISTLFHIWLTLHVNVLLYIWFVLLDILRLTGGQCSWWALPWLCSWLDSSRFAVCTHPVVTPNCRHQNLYQVKAALGYIRVYNADSHNYQSSYGPKSVRNPICTSLCV